MTLGENSFSVVRNIAMNMIVPRLTCIQNKSIESNFSFVFHGGRRIFSLKIKPNYSYQSESKFVNGILVSYHDLK